MGQDSACLQLAMTAVLGGELFHLLQETGACAYAYACTCAYAYVHMHVYICTCVRMHVHAYVRQGR